MLALLDHTLAHCLSFLVEIDKKEKTGQCYPFLKSGIQRGYLCNAKERYFSFL